MPISARKLRHQSAVPEHPDRRGVRQPRTSSPRTIGLGGLNEHLGYFMRRAQVWVFQDFIQALQGLDISPAQYSILHVISANAGLSQAELGRALGIERARLVRVLDRLDKRGLTRRLQSAADGRTHALRLSPKGQETLRRARELAARNEERLSAKIGAEPYRIVKNILREF